MWSSFLTFYGISGIYGSMYGFIALQRAEVFFTRFIQLVQQIWKFPHNLPTKKNIETR